MYGAPTSVEMMSEIYREHLLADARRSAGPIGFCPHATRPRLTHPMVRDRLGRLVYQAQRWWPLTPSPASNDLR